MIHVSTHALDRARQRLGASSDAEAMQMLTTPNILAAVAIGASAVILPSGHKVVIAGGKIVTVKPKHCRKRRVRGG